MKIIFFSILWLPLFAWTQSFIDLSHEELNPETETILIKQPEKYLRNESMIYDLNTDYGIKDQRRYTGGDRNRLSFAGHLNGNYEHLTDILGLEFAYLRRTERYNQIWWGVQFFAHDTYFKTISMNPGSGSDAQFNRPRTTRNSVWGAGPGVGYRFKLLMDFIETENVFETVDVYLNYLELNENFIRRKYRGYGLAANYGIHKRSSTNFFWGGKISYNAGAVTRRPLLSERRQDRSLSLGWLSTALEFGFLY